MGIVIDTDNILDFEIVEGGTGKGVLRLTVRNIEGSIDVVHHRYISICPKSGKRVLINFSKTIHSSLELADLEYQFNKEIHSGEISHQKG